MKKIFSTRTVAAILLALICALSIVGCAKQEEESVQYDLIPMVMVDGVLYLDTGYNGTYVTGDTYDRRSHPRCRAMSSPRKTINRTSVRATNIDTARGRARSRSK